MAHDIVKVEKLLPAYHTVLNTELSTTRLFNRANFDEFKGAQGDAVTIRVPGRLPAHKGYQFPSGPGQRPTRTSDIVFDEYAETKVTLAITGHAYSAVEILDEQTAFDYLDANSLVPVQGRAVAAQVNADCAAQVANAPYEFTIGFHSGVDGASRKALVEARRVINALGVPNEQRFLLVSGDVEAEFLNDPTITIAQNVGDAQASGALHEATLGSLLGFRIVVDNSLPAGSAYAFVPSAFVLRTAVPPVPSSVTVGSTYSAENIGLRWMRQYNLLRMKDQSVVDLYYGTNVVKDVYNVWDDATQREVIKDTEVFLRGIKLGLDVASAYNTTIADDLNIGSPKVTGV